MVQPFDFQQFFYERGCLDSTKRFSKKFLRVYGFLFINLGLNFFVIWVVYNIPYIICSCATIILFTNITTLILSTVITVYFEHGGISRFSFNSHFNYGRTSPVCISFYTWVRRENFGYVGKKWENLGYFRKKKGKILVIFGKIFFFQKRWVLKGEL